MTASHLKSSKVLVPSRIEQIVLCVVLLIALGLRMSHLDSMEFKGDEAFNLTKARELSRGQQFPLTSARSSTDIPEPPIFMYLLSLPIVISDDAIFVTASIALLNVFAIYLCYLIARRFFSPLTALISIFLFAVNPWQVLYSRKIWTQNLLPFFALLFLLFFFEALFRNRSRLLIAALITLSVTVQLHLSAFFLVPYTLILLIWHRRSVKLKHVLLGCALGLTLWIPYIVHLVINFNHFTQIVLELGQKTFIIRSSAAKLPLQLVSTDGFNDLTVLFHSYEKFNVSVIKIPVFDYLPRALLIVGIIYSLLKSNPIQRALSLYILLGLAFIFFSNSQIFPHYYNAQMPVYFILMSIPLARIIQNKERALSVTAVALILILAGYQLLFSTSFLRFVAKEDCIWSEYGPPYRVQLERMRSFVKTIDDQKSVPDLQSIHESVVTCVNWDILATKYLYEKLSSASIND